MTLRVLVIINRLEDNGGAEVSTSLLLEGLQGKGVEFRVITLFGPATIAARPSLEARGIEFLQAPPGFVRRITYVRRVARDWAPDVIHSTLFESDVAGAVAGSVLMIPTLTSMVSMPTPLRHEMPRRCLKLRIARHLVDLLRRIGFSHVHAIHTSRCLRGHRRRASHGTADDSPKGP